ncbi:hypothetical protein FH968_07410 [Buttiauxella sp. B2]|uniref:oligosaccharide flippase family protein n=1 Tax=Buttiauxella sp. B2 TaxID=2587812 RepID=UPI00111EA150|nr:oligosaccharide flippase family protein [Buttiauxella sp. B2]TNV21257.1 hypothetical protein FH968_07410 [Buttiauxella sp. B2]
MSIKKNIKVLAVAQVFTYLIPLLQLPYLSRTLDQQNFGLIIFTLSLTQMAMIVTDFGFDISIGKYIANGQSNKNHLGTFLYQTTLIRCCILLVFAIVFIVTVSYKSFYFNSIQYFSIVFAVVVVNAFNLRWLFYGLEKIYIFSIIVIISKGFSFVLVYIFISTNNDLINYPLILLVQSTVITIVPFFIVNKWGVRLIKCKKIEIWNEFKHSTDFFISRLCVSLYSSGCSVFLGMYGTGLHQVALYGVAEQLYKAGVQVFMPVVTALTPYMVRTKDYTFFKKVTLLFLIIVTTGSLIGFVWGDVIIKVIFGANYVEAKGVLNIFMVVIVASVLGMLFGYPALMPLNLERFANISVYISGLIQILIWVYFYFNRHLIDAINMSISYLICDWVMFLIRFIIFNKKHNPNLERAFK